MAMISESAWRAQLRHHDRQDIVIYSAFRIHVLPNGVDLQKFRPSIDGPPSSNMQRAKPTLLSVGHLLESKGHHIVIEALTKLPDATLCIVGEGSELERLRKLAVHLGVSTRVRFLGLVPHEEMAAVYGSADFTVLASANEGMPNVLLESLACGTRVIATAVGGNSEIVSDDVAGLIIRDRSSTMIAEAVRRLVATQHDRTATREFAKRFSWPDTVSKQVSLYRAVLDEWGENSFRVGAEAPR